MPGNAEQIEMWKEFIHDTPKQKEEYQKFLRETTKAIQETTSFLSLNLPGIFAALLEFPSSVGESISLEEYRLLKANGNNLRLSTGNPPLCQIRDEFELKNGDTIFTLKNYEETIPQAITKLNELIDFIPQIGRDTICENYATFKEMIKVVMIRKIFDNADNLFFEKHQIKKKVYKVEITGFY